MAADAFSDLVHGVTGQNRTLAHEPQGLIDRAVSLNRNATRGLGQAHREFAFAVRRPVPKESCGGNISYRERIMGSGARAV